MAQFDVYRTQDGVLVLDLQSDDLYGANTKIVAPLLPKEAHEKPIRRANPELTIDGSVYFLLAHFLSAIPASELKRPIASLEHEQYAIKSALDMLFYGF